MPMLPKSVIINGRPYSVILDDTEGGEWTSRPPEIHIGRQFDDYGRWEVFVHEVIEVTLARMNCRFEAYEGDYRFIFDHKEFIEIAKSVAHSLWPILGRKR